MEALQSRSVIYDASASEHECLSAPRLESTRPGLLARSRADDDEASKALAQEVAMMSGYDETVVVGFENRRVNDGLGVVFNESQKIAAGIVINKRPNKCLASGSARRIP
jgi:hypothetical protein